MSIKQQLHHSIFHLLKLNRHGSFATQYDRKGVLLHFATELVQLGYRINNIRQLKTKHIAAMVKHWQTKPLSNATIKNRLAVLRYVATVLNKPQLIPENTALGIGRRCPSQVTNKALVKIDLSLIKCDYVKTAITLQQLFGLRREEALKIKPLLADRGDHLYLASSWCKGGRARIIPIRNALQREWLDHAKQLAKENSLIPSNKNYIQQRTTYHTELRRAGLRNLHGLRHAYAQTRYQELTGWDAPLNGGLTRQALSLMQRELDQHARLIISEELGHSRLQITVNYLGR